MRVFGLVGKDLDYSFSKKYFTEYFHDTHKADCVYENFSLESINQFPTLLIQHPDISGLNVTIPYKELIIPYLYSLSKKAAAIGAVNVIRVDKNGRLRGYNSDCFGFKKSIKPLLQAHHRKALILGTGGASKAVAFALKEMSIDYFFVSRKAEKNTLTYDQINSATFENFQIVINCTPLGTFPNVEKCPPLPYQFFTEKHIAFDLVYNPEETVFLKNAKAAGAITKNGMEMLLFQAEKAWKIWNK